MPLHVQPPSTRTRFILTEGVLRRGTVVGVLVTLGYVWANLGTETFGGAWWRVALLLLLCFAEWTLGAGWVVGAVLWSSHQRTGSAAPHGRSDEAGRNSRS